MKTSPLHWSLAAALAFTAAGALFLTQTAAADDEADCGEFGTSVAFEESPAAAAKKAMKEEKLVMVLHVSGNFETPEYT